MAKPNVLGIDWLDVLYHDACYSRCFLIFLMNSYYDEVLLKTIAGPAPYVWSCFVMELSLILLFWSCFNIVNDNASPGLKLESQIKLIKFDWLNVSSLTGCPFNFQVMGSLQFTNQKFCFTIRQQLLTNLAHVIEKPLPLCLRLFRVNTK